MQELQLFLLDSAEELEAIQSEEFADTALAGLSEAKLTAELLRRGHKIARPVVDDDGVDLIVNYRITVQVKATRKPNVSRGVYQWRIARGQVHRGLYGRYGHQRTKSIPGHVDIVVLHALDIDGWWIVPRGDLVATSNHWSVEHSALAAYRDAWHLLG